MRLLALSLVLVFSTLSQAATLDGKIEKIENFGFPVSLEDGTFAVIGELWDARHYLDQYSTDGKLLNSIYLGDKFVRGCAPVSHGNTVVVHDGYSESLLIIDMTTKKITRVNHIEGGHMPNNCMAMSKDKIVINLEKEVSHVAGYENYFIDLSGNIISSTTCSETIRSEPIILSGGQVVLGCGNKVNAFSPVGEKLWSSSFFPAGGGSAIYLSPDNLVGDDKIWFSAGEYNKDLNFFVIDKFGKTVMKKPLGGKIAALPNGFVIRQHELLIFTDSSGKVLKEINVGYMGGGLTVFDGSVFVGTFWGNYYNQHQDILIFTQDGKEVGKIPEVGNPGVPQTLSDGTIAFPTSGGISILRPDWTILTTAPGLADLKIINDVMVGDDSNHYNTYLISLSKKP